MVGANVQHGFSEDHRGRIWFSTDQQLHYYDPPTDRVVPVVLRNETGDTLNPLGTRPFYYDHFRKVLWLSAEGKICQLKLSSEHCSCSSHATKGFNFTPVLDRRGALVEFYAAPWLLGNHIERYRLTANDSISKQNILPDIRKAIRVVATEEHAYVLDDGSIYRFDPDRPDTYTSIYRAAEGNRLRDLRFYPGDRSRLVFSSDDGIYELEPATGRAMRLFNESTRQLWIDSTSIWSDSPDAGVWWSLTSRNNFTAIAPGEPVHRLLASDSGEIRYLQENRLEVLFQPSSGIELTLPSIYDLIALPDAWLLLSDTGVWQLKSGRLSNILRADTLNFRNGFRLPDGRVFATTIQGLFELQMTQDSCRLAPSRVFDLPGEFPVWEYRQRDGRLLLYTSDDRLLIYQLQPDLKLLHEVAALHTVYSFIPDRYSVRYYLGTEQGLKYLRNDSIVRVATRHRELLSVPIYDLQEDRTGHLWLATDKGLWQWNSETDALYKFNRSDGLVGDHLSRFNNLLRLPDGRIALATDNGITLFHPDSIRPHREPPHVHLESLLVNDRRNITAPGFQTAIELAHYEDNLLFELLPVTLFRPERARILYQMEGYDDRPVEVERGQLIRYVRMPPGNYTFRAQAIDDNGNRSAWLTLPVRIRPPWWQTWWFYALLSVSALTAAILFYRRRLRVLRREEAVKRQLVELELQVAENELKALRAQMNPHFLFNVMNSIKSIIIARQTDRSIHYLTQLSKLIRTILANSEKKLISLDRELEALKLYIQLEALRFDDDFDYSVLLGDDIETDFIRIPPLILQPFAENAIRHGLVPRKGLRRLKLHIYREGDFVLFEMEDNGIGRAAAARESRARTGHHSMGLDITRRRLQLADARNDFHFVDLTDGEKRPVGTRVVLRVWWAD